MIQGRLFARYMPDPEVSVDLYEVLQISPSADLETIQRVYRLLALRYHPDNKETGNPSEFELVLKAYRVLSDPETRASYDSEYYYNVSLKHIHLAMFFARLVAWQENRSVPHCCSRPKRCNI